MGGCGLSRHQCGFAWIKGDCTRLAGGEAVVLGGRVVVVWCWVVSRSSSSHGVGARRAEVWAGWLSLALGETGRETRWS